MTRLVCSCLLVLALAGCHPGGDPSGNPSSMASIIGQAPVEDCPNGGVVVGYGIDDNVNGYLDAEEVDDTQTICRGEDGAQGPQGETGAAGADGEDGYSALVSVDSEVGDNCFGGSTGTRIQAGTDNGDGGGIARDGILQAGEVDSTVYLCIDCAGDLNGTDSSCVDCAGVFNGGAVEDACGVCGGDGTSCLDCAGVLNGDDFSCADCAGVLNGTAEEDECGVCQGDGTSCLDCAGVPNGDSVEDACGVCDGDGSSCADCAGVPNGDAVEDVCGVCGGLGPINDDESLCGFVLIEADIFTMGSPESEPGHDGFETRDETQHEVTLTNDFYLSVHEVTQAEWQALIGNNPSQKNNGTCPTCPVETVNWWEALHYANALSESEGLRACYVLSGCNGNAVGSDRECTGVTLQDGSGFPVTTPYECEGYRLPTEAEWEYAARAGTTTAYYNGDIAAPEGSEPNPNESDVDEIAWYDRNSGDRTHPVGQKMPNAWGLYDMSGNVWEWVWDWYGDYSGDITDPAGPSSGTYRVIRGGSWDYHDWSVRVASRNFWPPGNRYDNMGFRFARTVQ